MKINITHIMLSIFMIHAYNTFSATPATKTTSSTVKHLNMSQAQFKLLIKKVLKQAAQQQKTSVSTLLHSKKIHHTPVKIAQTNTTIQSTAAQVAQQAKQKAKKTFASTPKTTTKTIAQ